MMKRYIQPSSRITAIVEEMRICNVSSITSPVSFADETITDTTGL